VIELGLTRSIDVGLTRMDFLRTGGLYLGQCEGRYVLIALNGSTGHDRVGGPWLRSTGWVEPHRAEPGPRVRGVMMAKAMTDDLKRACARRQGVQRLAYALSVTLIAASTASHRGDLSTACACRSASSVAPRTPIALMRGTAAASWCRPVRDTPLPNDRR
jgi:hypothetical protein